MASTPRDAHHTPLAAATAETEVTLAAEPADNGAEMLDTIASGEAPTEALAGPPSSRHRASAAGESGEPAERMTLLPGDPRRIDRFVLLSRLGTGGMGVVFAAYDEKLDRRVALKLLRADDDAHTESRGLSRLLRKVQVTALINHPNLIAVYDVGTHDGRGLVAMGVVRGTTLDAWVRDGKVPGAPSSTRMPRRREGSPPQTRRGYPTAARLPRCLPSMSWRLCVWRLCVWRLCV